MKRMFGKSGLFATKPIKEVASVPLPTSLHTGTYVYNYFIDEQPISGFQITGYNKEPTWKKHMPVNGQGIFTFNIERNTPFCVLVREDDKELTHMIKLEVAQHAARFIMHCKGEQRTLVELNCQDSGYEPNEKISYWFSYDRDRLVLKYGKGYYMEETTLLTYDFLLEARTEAERHDIRAKYHKVFNAETKMLVELYDQETFFVRSPAKSLKDVEDPVEFDKNPFICNLSPFVLDSTKVTLFVLDSDRYMLSGSLPPTCKELYENIKNCELDWPCEVDDMPFSDAIRYSINTNGCLLYEKLREKASSKATSEETYLRITLGQSFGNSPGIPYVLEIWPSRHFSPIHNHGNANAVIKVLFGTIHVSIFNKQTKNTYEKPIKTFHVQKGDVTWINRNWFQTHQLRNVSEDFCATLQCYSYDAGDTTHWPYFDYVKENSVIDEFLPNSDFTFREMRNAVMKEYKVKHNRKNICIDTL